MKILEVTAFSSGICGVWTRVQNEAEQLSKKGHDLTVFSSNIKRGSGKIEYAPEFEEKNKVKIKRFHTFGSFGENTFFWNYEKHALKLKPDIIITHTYRQYYSTKALKLAKKLKIPCILVTHAPFLNKKLRSLKLNIAVWFYDKFLAPKIINKYSKIIAITKWEIPFLLKLGCDKNKIEYLPNGVPEEFFKSRSKKGEGILFLGRISPVKNIEILIKALNLIKNKKIKLNLVGPAEKNYQDELKVLIKKLNTKNIKFLPPVYDLKEKIKLIDNYEIFILPSKREAMPQALIEAMARGKIVISSKTDGGKEIIQDNVNGFLFEINNEKQLAEIIIKIKNMSKKEKTLIRKNAIHSVKKFSWKELIKKLGKLIKSSNSFSKSL